MLFYCVPMNDRWPGKGHFGSRSGPFLLQERRAHRLHRGVGEDVAATPETPGVSLLIWQRDGKSWGNISPFRLLPGLVSRQCWAQTSG